MNDVSVMEVVATALLVPWRRETALALHRTALGFHGKLLLDIGGQNVWHAT